MLITSGGGLSPQVEAGHEVHRALGPGRLALAGAAQHLGGANLLGRPDAGRHSPVAGVGGAAARDGGQDVGAVPVLVVEGAGGVGGEVQPAGVLVEIEVRDRCGVTDHEAGVQDADLHRGSAVSREPQRRGARTDHVGVDQRHALVVVGRRRRDQLDEEHEVEASDRVDRRLGRDPAIEVEWRVVLADGDPGGFELATERSVVVGLEEVDDDRQRRVGGDAGRPGPIAPQLRQLPASLLVAVAEPDPLDLGQGGDLLERADGQAGLVVVVVRTEELDAQPGQRLLDGLVERHAKQDEAVHELTAAGRGAGRLGLQCGIETRGGSADAGREAEPAFRARTLPPRVGLVLGRGRVGLDGGLRARGGAGWCRDERAFPCGLVVCGGCRRIGGAGAGGRGVVCDRGRRVGLGQGHVRPRRRGAQHVVRDLGEHAAVVAPHRFPLACARRRRERRREHGDQRREGKSAATGEMRSARWQYPVDLHGRLLGSRRRGRGAGSLRGSRVLARAMRPRYARMSDECPLGRTLITKLQRVPLDGHTPEACGAWRVDCVDESSEVVMRCCRSDEAAPGVAVGRIAEYPLQDDGVVESDGSS